VRGLGIPDSLKEPYADVHQDSWQPPITLPRCAPDHFTFGFLASDGQTGNKFGHFLFADDTPKMQPS
jgi:hypothetical protein